MTPKTIKKIGNKTETTAPKDLNIVIAFFLKTA
jgi:hypothetical protein